MSSCHIGFLDDLELTDRLLNIVSNWVLLFI